MNPAPVVAITIFATLIFSCAKSTDGKSPQFLPGTIVKIFGKFVDEGGNPLADNHINLQNLREFAYIDYGSPDPAKISQNFAAIINAIFFPFYPKYRYDADVYNRKIVRPDHLETTLNTNAAGEFNFEIEAEKFLRDANDGINISITNQEVVSGAFGRAAFIIKEEDTDLGTLTLCNNPVNVIEEADNTVTFSFEPPLFDVHSYIVNFGDAETNALIWSQTLPSSQTTLNLPNVIFSNRRVRVSYEAYSIFLTEKKISCLAAPIEFQPNHPKSSLIAGALASSPSILFKINSLTNGDHDDPLYLEALNTKTLTFALPQPVEGTKLVFHNLLLKGTGDIIIKVNAEDYVVEASRFFVVDLNRNTAINSIEIKAPTTIIDLKEISVH